MFSNDNVAGGTGLTIRNIIQTLKARAFGVVVKRASLDSGGLLPVRTPKDS